MKQLLTIDFSKLFNLDIFPLYTLKNVNFLIGVHFLADYRAISGWREEFKLCRMKNKTYIKDEKIIRKDGN